MKFSIALFITLITFCSDGIAQGKKETPIHIDKKNITGLYKQTQIEPALEKPVIKYGRFFFMHKKGLIWTQGKSYATYNLTRGNSFQLSEGKWEKTKGNKSINRLIQLIIELDVENLAHQFSIQREIKGKTEEIKLTPKRKKVSRFIQDITVIKGKYIEEIVLKKSNGASISLEFQDQTMTAALTPDTCAFHLELTKIACTQLGKL